VSSGTEQDDLERMLAASRELRSGYRAASQEQPSAQVDDAIRAHARRAVGARPRSTASPFGASWRVPLSIAAVLVLSVTLTVMITRQDRHLPSAESPPMRDALSQGAPARAPDEPSQQSSQPPASQPQQAEVSPATRQPSQDQASSADAHVLQAPKRSSNAEENAAERREKTRAATAPEVQSSAAKDPTSTQGYQAPAQEPSPDESKLKKEAQPFPATPPAPAAAPVPRAEPAPAAVPPARTAVQAEAMHEREQDQTFSDAAAGASQRGLVTGRQDAAPRPSGANATDPQSNFKAEQSAAGSLEARGARQKQVAPAVAAARAGESTQSAASPTAAPWESDPKAWLRHIETLVRDKHMSEARDSFKAFRQRYPAYPVPSEFPLREP
jgi:hypothetical protein